MTTYEYLINTIGEERVIKLAKSGVLSAKIVTYMRIYEYHVRNGKKRTLTAEHFNMPSPSVGYALQQMKREI